MNKAVELLLKKMSEDKAFAELIITQTEREKVIEIALESGIDLRLEDIDEANEIIAKAVARQTEGELSEEELENVAGGTFEWVVLSMILSAVTVTASLSGGVTVSITIAVYK